MTGLSTERIQELEGIAFRTRENIIRMATGGGCFIGASLSAVEVITYLYKQFLQKPFSKDLTRDYFFLSKGHDVPALYGAWAEMGYFEKDRLKSHLSTKDHIYWHPNTKVSGVEFHSGSLGHLLSVAIGVALDCKLRKQSNRIVVMVGDGELNEGSNWEAFLVAQAYHLDNLVVVVDRNEFQANMATEELIPLEPLSDKFKAFGLECRTIDGHNFAALEDAFGAVSQKNEGPQAIIARTVRGKGLPSIERRADRWFCNFTEREIEDLLLELRSGEKARLESETLVVR